RLEIPVDTVRTRLKRALGRIEQRLDKKHGGDRRAWLLALVPLCGYGSTARASAAVAPTAKTKGLIATAALLCVACVAYLAWFERSEEPVQPPQVVTPSVDAPADESKAETTATPVSEKPAVAQPPNPILNPVRGLVLDSRSGEPVAGAAITLTSRSAMSSWPGKRIATTVSGADGRYVFLEHEAEPTQQITVRHESYVPYPSNGHGGARSAPLAIREDVIYLSPGVAVHGEVLFEDDTPVPGGFGRQLTGLRAYPRRGGRVPKYASSDSAKIEIDSKGRFTTRVDAVHIAFEVWGDAFQPAYSGMLSVDPDTENRVVLRVRRSRTLRGIVRDSESRAIANAHVSCLASIPDHEPDHHFEAYRATFRTRTDAEGRFELKGLGDGYHGLSVRHPAYQTFFEPVRTPAETAKSREIELATTTWIQGVLRGSQGERLTRLPQRATLVGARAVFLRIERDGSFRCVVPPANAEASENTRSKATLRVGGFLPATVELTQKGTTIDVGEVRLQPGRSVQVTVRDDATGSLVERASVTLTEAVPSVGWQPSSSSADTDSEGVA
ncbi:MAG: carboxypeptidase-like regulatory domain-containing protein, partial [Planctomycetota bacterium]